MKNLFIVLLIAAIGAGAYLYLGKEQNHNSLQPKKLIVGKWGIDSLKGFFTNSSSPQNRSLLDSIDSNFKKIEFEFRDDSMVIQTFDKKIFDTSYYSFANEQDILIWRNADTTTKEKFKIVTLDSSKLSLRDNDSTILYFSKDN